MTDVVRRILIVDDDPDIVANISDILNEAGYDTVTATDGQSALDRIDRPDGQGGCAFDLALLDFRMPDMDGAELFRQIHKRYPELRAIMITAFAGDDGVNRALEAGTWRVLHKPVDVAELLGMISEAVGQRA
ncbi:MAG: response regulator [Pirellulaceae bacterium]